jgi:succinate dehydrogenase / fumarate reductase iron-sulfur subunit
LACKTLIKEVAEKDGDTVTVEPLRYLPVQRDLIVDQGDFFKNTVRSALFDQRRTGGRKRAPAVPGRAHAVRRHHQLHSLRLLLLGLPVLEDNPAFLGPAAIAQAYRFNADTRDRGFDVRLEALDQPDGVWPCQNHFKCTQSCPRGILITKRINQTKRMIEKTPRRRNSAHGGVGIPVR